MKKYVAECPKCKKPLIYFPDKKLVCANKKCKLYAPKTYDIDDLGDLIT